MKMQEIIALAAEQDASDIYLKSETCPTLRIVGKLAPIGEELLTEETVLALVREMATERQMREFEEHWELNFAYYVGSHGRFRVNVYRQRASVAVVMRRVRMDIPTVDSLKLPQVLKEVSLDPRGLVLVTGATGSGKSTTLAAMLDHRNTNRQGHIITIEDPIEYLHQDKRCLVSQREVGTDTASFAEALRNALRQTPDVILIGEMRDVESVTAALHFAETGHLVLSTLHAPNANQAIERVLQFFPPTMHEAIYQQLSFNLRAVVSQRLVTRKDGRGRLPVVEVMLASPRIREIIQKGELVKLKGAIEASAQEGMQSFDQAVLQLHGAGLISIDDALAAADSPNDVRLRMRGLTTGNVIASS